MGYFDKNPEIEKAKEDYQKEILRYLADEITHEEFIQAKDVVSYTCNRNARIRVKGE